MNFKTEQIGDIRHVKMPMDALDAGNILDFKTDIAPVIQSAKKVVFNMTKVKFMDSSGVGAMLSCLRTINSNGGELKLYGVKDQLLQLFKLVRLDRIIDIYDSKKAAVTAFQSGSER